MDFRLEEEQQMLQDAIHRLAAERMRATYREADEDGELPADVVQAGWEMGLLPTAIPEAFGGLGEHSVTTNVVAIEALAWGDLAMTIAIMQPALFAVPIMLAGTDAQKEEWLPRFCGPKPPTVTAALMEKGIHFDPRQLRTSAERGNGDFVLNGKKTMSPLADSAGNILVYANEAGKTQAFIVAADGEGVTVGERDKLMGIKALPTFEVDLQNVTVPASARLGGEAGIDFEKILAHSRVALGAAAVGVARASYEYAMAYAKDRVQFGEPVAHRQSIAFMLAEMAIDIDAARLMVWEAAWLLDQGEPTIRETALLKHTIDEMVLKVCDRGLQALGGHGYIREHPVEMWLRNARGFSTFDGLLIA